MKKILATVLALLMALTITGAVFTQSLSAEPLTDTGTISLSKQFKLTKAGTTNQAETFNFKITPHSVTDAGAGITTANMPMFTPFSGTGANREYATSIAFIAAEATLTGETNNTTLTFPAYDTVGIYKYRISETAGSTAGVTYDSNPMYLTVTVVQTANGLIRLPVFHYGMENGSKSEHFKNEYSAGSIQVAKTVSGLFGDLSKYFNVVITLTGETGKTYAPSYPVSGGSHASNPATIAIGAATTFQLKHGETLTIDNLPYGVTYTVVEADYTGEEYDAAAYTFSDGLKLINSANDTVGILNNKGGTPDTGISLDSLPYILMALLAGTGLIVYLARRRKLEE